MDSHRLTRLTVAASTLCLLAANTLASPVTAAPTPSAVVSTADPAAQVAATASKGTPETPSIAATLSAVQEISRELKRVDDRLAMLDRSLAGVDASLKPVGALTEPDALQAAVARAADLLFERARALILLLALCAAALLVLQTLLQRWSKAQGPWPSSAGGSD